MYRYVVVDTNKDNRLVALRDPAGRYHVAHCTSELPQVQAVLDGQLPSVGFALAIGDAGKVYRLVFSQINCSQVWVLRLLHPQLDLPEPYQMASVASATRPGGREGLPARQ